MIDRTVSTVNYNGLNEDLAESTTKKYILTNGYHNMHPMWKNQLAGTIIIGFIIFTSRYIFSIWDERREHNLQPHFCKAYFVAFFECLLRVIDHADDIKFVLSL